MRGEDTLISSSEVTRHNLWGFKKDTLARTTGLEPATSCVTGRHSNQLNYVRASVRFSYSLEDLMSTC